MSPIERHNPVRAVGGNGVDAQCKATLQLFFFIDDPRMDQDALFVKLIDQRAIMVLSVVAPLVGGFLVSAAFGTIFAIINWYLVARTEDRSQRNIADLFGGQLRTVWLLIDGVEVETPIETVHVGDIVVVHTGQMIPVDGTIAGGTATIDQHMLTGESQPVEKGAGDPVLASTVVLAGRLYIHVDKACEATVASQITEMLSQTADYKQLIQSRTDRWLNRTALPILGLSALALPLVGIEGAAAVLWHYPGFRMTIFGPVSMLSYLQIAAQRGILVKDGRALEVLQEVDTVVFDKTGTLTLEQPTVSRVLCYNGVAEADVLRYAAAAEAKQSHPIARAILQAAHEHELDLPLLEDAEYKVGYGLKTQIAGRTTCVGSVRFMTAEGIVVPAAVAIQQAESHAQGHSLVLVALDGEVVGAIELQPTLRPEARQIIQELHARGIETAIISGDNDAPTRRLAAELGIDRYFAEVLPEDKANLVTQLQEEGHKVCFVGDGINDSIALKTADVAISLRGATTIATDMAEIVFMDGTLGQLPELFALADDFAANMRTNMLAAVVPGVIGIAGTFLFGWGMGICVLLAQGHADFPLLLTSRLTGIMPADSAATIGESGIGTGPFKLETLDVEGTTVLTANDDYWDGTPGVAGVELPALPDSEARVLALQSGQVDLVLDVTMAQTELFAGNDSYTVLRYPSGTWSALVMRTDMAPFDDVRVRQAMRLVADRQAIIDLVLGGAGTVTCDTPVAPSDVYRWEGDCPQDIEGAKALLAEAGYPDGINVTLYTSDSSQEQIPMSEVYQQQAAAAGINVTLEIAPSDSFWSDVWRVEPLVTTFWHERPADEILNLNWRSTAAWNESYFQDAEFDQLLDEARTALDFESRRDLYLAAQQLLTEEGGHVIPFHVDSFHVASAALSDVSARSWPHIDWHLISKSE